MIEWLKRALSPSPIPYIVLDALAQSVANEVHSRTGMLVGHRARWDGAAQRVIFTFVVGVNPPQYEEWTIESLKGAHSFSAAANHMIDSVLQKNTPWALSLRLNQRKQGTWEPEIKPFVDQYGRRHFRLQAEVGVYTNVFNPIGA